MSKNLFPTIVVCILMIPCWLISDDSTIIRNEDLNAMSLQELLSLKVSGVSKYEQSINTAPANVTIITREMILERLYFDLSDLLRDQCNVDISDHARGYGEYYTIRGIGGNDRFLVLIDGEKLNPVSGAFLSVGNSICLALAQRVEIIMGPGSAIYGADAFSGIINIVTRQDHDESYIKACAGYGSFNTIHCNLRGNYMLTDDWSLSASASLYQSDAQDLVGRDKEYDIIELYESPLSDEFSQPISDYNLFFKTKYKDFSLSYFRQAFNEGNAWGQQTASVVYNEECKWAFTNDIIWANYKHSFDDYMLSADLAYVRYALDPETQFLKWKNGAFLEETFSQYMTGINNTVRGTVTGTTEFFDEIHIVGGIEFELSESIPPYANDQVLASSDKYTGATADAIDNALTIEQQRYAGFLQFTYSPSEWIDFIIGGRYDYFSDYDNSVNPRIAVVVNPDSKTNIKLMYGTAFQAPSLFYQYEQWGAVTAVMLSESEIQETEPDWKLKNQKISSGEIVISRRIIDGLSLSLSPYFHKLDNLIERVLYTDSAYNKYFSTPDSAVYSLGFRNENIGKQEIYGITGGIDYSNDYLDASIKYSYTQAVAKKDGGDEDVPRIAKHKLHCMMTFTQIFDIVNISFRYKVLGDINNRNTDAYPDGLQPGYQNLDISLYTVPFWETVSFYLKGYNILDSKYSHGGLIDQVVYLPKIPQPGITIVSGVMLSL